MSTARAALDAAITEKAFQQTVVDYAKLHGWMVYHTHRSTKSEYGFPDDVLVRADWVIFAEIKTERGKLSPAQRAWLCALVRIAEHTRGVGVFIWRPSSWPVIERILA